MKSHYKKLGLFIKQINNLNTDGKVKNLLGVNLAKKLMPSIAKIHGVDLTKYKLLVKNQFACKFMSVGRDKKLPIGFYQKDKKAIVSSAYYIFKSSDENILSSEYLMMWLSRDENDRLLWFKSGADIRGSISWEDFCDIDIPIPPIEKQHEIVREYNVVNNRIKLNEKIIQKLEETAQAIYKQWFVDFEFPITKEYAESIGNPELEGKPYKSSGGKMVYCDELDKDIPVSWRWGTLSDIATQFSGYSFNGEEYTFFNGTTVIRGENVTEGKLRFDTHKMWDKKLPERAKTCYLENQDIVIGMDGSKVGKNWALISPYQLPLLLAQRVCCVRANNYKYQIFIYISIKVQNFSKYISQIYTGTSVPHVSSDQIMNFNISIPNDLNLIYHFNIYAQKFFDFLFIKQQEIEYLNNLKTILLSKISKV
jgi:type I restriction enzyme S subunit